MSLTGNNSIVCYVYYNKPRQGHSTNYRISNDFECLTDNNVFHQNTSKVFKFMRFEYKTLSNNGKLKMMLWHTLLELI